MSQFSQALRTTIPLGADDPLGLGVYCGVAPDLVALPGGVAAGAVVSVAWETPWVSRVRIDGSATGGSGTPMPTLYVELWAHAVRDDEGFRVAAVQWDPQAWSLSEAVLQVAGVLGRFWELRGVVLQNNLADRIKPGWRITADRLPGPDLVLGPNVQLPPP